MARFFYQYGKQPTMEELARELGIKKSGVNMTEKYALKKLKQLTPPSYKDFLEC